MQIVILSRHGESTFNVEGRVNGNPATVVPLTEAGRRTAAQLGQQLAPFPIDLCLHTRFGRTQETAAIALEGRGVPFATEPLLDDIDVGELDGAPVEAYRDWKEAHARDDEFPGGESLDDAARRYARAFRTLLARPERTALVVCHEIPIRYALNALTDTDDLDRPLHDVANATPYLFDAATLERAVARIESLVGGTQGTGAE